MIPPVYICGQGNLGTALVLAFRQNGIEPAGIFSGSGKPGTLAYGDVQPGADSLVFLCVPDDALAATAELMKAGGPVLIHCSGALPLGALPGKRKGVFYPLQSFSRSLPLPDWKGLPVFVHSEQKDIQDQLMGIGQKLGAEIRQSSDQERASLHLAAVFANNFSNLMYLKAWEICEARGLDPKLLQPLIRRGIQKLEAAGPKLSQTGPALRGDLNTMEKHLEMIEDKELKALYELLSAAIMAAFQPDQRK